MSEKTKIKSLNPVGYSIMTSNGRGDDISLREPEQLNTGQQELNTGDNAEQNVRQRNSDRNRVFALVGSALSQLPIWGMIPGIFVFR